MTKKRFDAIEYGHTIIYRENGVNMWRNKVHVRLNELYDENKELEEENEQLKQKNQLLYEDIDFLKRFIEKRGFKAELESDKR